MKLVASIALLCTLALASSPIVFAEGEGSAGSGSGPSGNSTGNSTNSSSPGDVTKAPGGGVPAPANDAGYVTWQTTVATFAATAVAVALV